MVMKMLSMTVSLCGSINSRYVFAILLSFASYAEAHGTSVGKAYQNLVALAKKNPQDCAQVATRLARNFTTGDYESLVVKLKLSGLDLADVGGEGVTCLENAKDRTLYQLAGVPGGDIALVRLLEHQSLRWDGAESHTLCDAMVRVGKPMVPLLEKIKSKNRAWAHRCSDVIKSGANTAF
jgi:hypothetical protein